jgi:hypothetical protein
LVVAGAITCPDLGGERAIAAWDGSSWVSLGGGCLGYQDAMIHALEVVDPTHLVAAGFFEELGGTPAENVAVWNGVGWSELDGGITAGNWSGVLDMCLSPQGLVLAGDIIAAGGAGGVEAAGLVVWSPGSGWTAPLGSVESEQYCCPVQAVAVHDEHLVIAGEFTAVDGVPAANIAFLDAGGWTPLGAGISAGQSSSYVSTLLVLQDALFVGGDFELAGDKSSFCLARFDCGLPVGAGELPLAQAILLGQNYPNPFNPSTTIAWSQPAAAAVSLSVMDIAGRRVRTLLAGEPRDAGPQEAVWDGRDDRGILQSSGVYFYRLDCAGQTNARSMHLVK